MRIFLSGTIAVIVVYFILELLLYSSGTHIEGTSGALRRTINQVLVVAFICGALTEIIKQIKE